MRAKCFVCFSLAVGLVVLVSCAEREQAVDPLASVYPDSVLVRMERAWDGRDIAAYGEEVLYDGKLPDADGKTHTAFTFFRKGAGDETGELLYGYDQEVKIAGAMFEGKAKEDGTPALRSIDISIERRGDWEAIPPGETVLGDRSPSGTKRCPFDGSLRLTFEDVLPGTEKDSYGIDHHGTLYVIPVQVADGSGGSRLEYRIWKWVDEAPAAEEG